MSDSLDWDAWVSEQRHVSETDCARLRRRLNGSTEQLSKLCEGDWLEYTRTQLSRHANGRCSHDHGVPPVTSVRRWEAKENG